MFVFDNDMNVRLASQELQDGTIAYFRPKNQYPRSTDSAEWVEYMRVDVEDKPITMLVLSVDLKHSDFQTRTI